MQEQPLIGNAAVLKRVNTIRVLNHLYRGGPASRADLARATGLDAKTMTNVCNDLLVEKLLLHDRQVAHGRGRPAERLSLNPDAAFAVGVDFGANQVTVVLADLTGKMRKIVRREFDGPKAKDYLLNCAIDAVGEQLESLATDQRQAVKGVGISVPGMLDRAKGIVRHSVNIRGFREVPIVDIFSDRLRHPVFLEEASCSFALAEVWFGPRDVPKDFVCLDLGYGIGMGIIHEGRLYRGANDVSGEVGHTVVEPRGARCACGKRGCLETVASGKALGDIAKKLSLKNPHGARSLHEAALAGNKQARRALERAGECIGIAAANIINLLDPGCVVINGGLVKAGALLTDPLCAAAKAHAIRRPGHECPIHVSSLGVEAGAMGAAMLPLRNYFEMEHVRF